MKLSFWQGVFLSKGLINWIESLGLLALDPWLRTRFNLTPLVNWEYAYLFAALAFIFGLGYWQVGRDLSQNREVIRMGIFGQYAVFFILLATVLSGHLIWPYLIPASVDGVYATLYSGVCAGEGQIRWLKPLLSKGFSVLTRLNTAISALLAQNPDCRFP
ncbi:MAG: hypothetical protein ACK5CA_11170 [Cyanobacteriota bacterium]